MTPALELRNVTKTFTLKGGFGRVKSVTTAVNNVSLSIMPGESFGLAGESGSGKSTIARMIMGLALPDSGDILVDGVSILSKEAPRDLKSRVQMVFQSSSSSLNPRRTVGQSIAVPLVAHGYGGHRAARIAELLEMVQLPAAFANRYPHELSGGQKQRVAVARALAVGAKLLVLDEPTSALDVSVQAKVIELLEGLQREMGLTYLFISHDLSLMRNFTSRVGVLYRGDVVETGATSAVFTHPQHDYTRLLLASVPVVSAEEEALRPIIPLINGELPTAEELLALRQAGGVQERK
ncbi:ATP-binding cassette domain-containing protein [Ketogulonicigenium vulgare]|uniref:ATP-binding cassette domain-containing protein n=1 Tax=Ketogulonicigenium vulgare TaxID=92945 RepID=UPI002359554A|nr:ATP-binding cassette domain-containing protein [Ketogulonicigenium vulgare]